MRVALVAAAVTVAFAGCTNDSGASGLSASNPAEGQMVVELRDFEFSPKELWIKRGTSVVFRNVGEFVHNAEGEDGSWGKNVDIKKGASGTYSVSGPGGGIGDVPFVCKYHKTTRGMVGVIHVV